MRVLFGLKFEIEGLELAGPGPVMIMIRHASIIDNMLPDAVVVREHGIGLRFVLKRELQMIPVIDIGGRWVPTNYVRRASADPEAEIAGCCELTQDLGPGEGILIYPEGTRYTPKKLARAQEMIAERHPSSRRSRTGSRTSCRPASAARWRCSRRPPESRHRHLRPRRLRRLRVHQRHLGGGLVGQTIKIKFWRVPGRRDPRRPAGADRWLYDHWQELDDWVGEQREDPTSPRRPRP